MIDLFCFVFESMGYVKWLEMPLFEELCDIYTHNKLLLLITNLVSIYACPQAPMILVAINQ